MRVFVPKRVLSFNGEYHTNTADNVHIVPIEFLFFGGVSVRGSRF